MKRKQIFVIVLILVVFLFIFFFKKPYNPCQWVSVNCCPENAGAQWRCVDMRNFTPPNCSGFVICPQVISPKPNKDCIFENGRCVVR